MNYLHLYNPSIIIYNLKQSFKTIFDILCILRSQKPILHLTSLCAIEPLANIILVKILIVVWSPLAKFKRDYLVRKQIWYFNFSFLSSCYSHLNDPSSYERSFLVSENTQGNSNIRPFSAWEGKRAYTQQLERNTNLTN